MKRIIDTSEVLGAVEMPEGRCEVCTSAEAGFDEEAGRLVVKLEAFLRPSGLLVKERHFRADWLPANETVTESVSREEFVEELLERGFAIRAIKHEGLDLPKHDFDRIIKTAAGMLASKHVCASLGIKAEEEKFRFGFTA